ncbi:sugar transferase [Actinotalea sp. K2]|uniref:sugar transferase n=1 Tax=Actinotalea sp. K2 TaxID=2939438 RepID=UPI002016E2C8|nr:sugar transferase [Actinotalea sp. K2]MCL3861277.1 sugar transferase [Actinotalea sp. K2]
MTLAAERGLEWANDDDRRARAVEPRRSWASAQPFVPRSTPFNDQAARAGHWAKVALGYQRRVVVVDALATVAVGAGLAWTSLGRGVEALGTVLLASVGFVVLVAVARGYETKTLGDGPAEFQAIIRAGVMSAAVLMTLSYAFQTEISRTVVFLGTPAVVLLASLGRYTHRRFLHRERSHGQAMMSTLVVGDYHAVARVVGDLAAAPYHGYQVSGVCLSSIDEPSPFPDVPVVGALADIPQVVADRAVDVVVVAGTSISGEGLRRLTWALDRAGAQLIVAPDIVEVTSPRLTLRPTAGLSLLAVEVGSPRRRMIAKAALDRTAGLVLLLMAAPVIAGAALAVRLTSPGSPFYPQTRVGVDGATFTMWKIRSMYVDAAARKAELADLNEADGALFKMRADPRVTPVGRVLRRFSLDELPQLANVVKGDMSLVGPRPPLAEEVAVYEDAVHRRLRVKPGLTGLWQVSGRSDLSWEESVRLDLRYVDNWSVAMDLEILWKTARAVLRGSGAY